LAIVFIANRQLGLYILVHEASHRALFKTTWLNDTFADCIFRRPIFIEIEKHRKHHIVHRKTGKSGDIDYSLVKNLPNIHVITKKVF
jgi:fatty acid desaturase